MKKLFMVTAIAAVVTLSKGAHAQIASDIGLNIGLPLGFDVETNCTGLPGGGNTFLSVASTNSASFLIGTFCLDPNLGVPPYVLLQFGLTTTTWPGGPSGIWFDSGTTDIYLDSGTGNWVYYATVDASIAGNEVDCLGLVWSTTSPYYVTLPGAAGPACYANVLGMPAELYLFP